jgi:uncharacterized protein
LGIATCWTSPAARGQTGDMKFIADTLVVQADGSYEADPDVATMIFDITSQDKELKPTYDRASESMQKIISLAEKNGLKKEDISSGVLTVTPYYEGDRRKKAKSYAVRGQIALRVHDFSKLGPILEGSVEDGITDFRSLSYSLSDEEAAKQKAVGAAMRNAIGRANAALGAKGQKVGALRFSNLDVKQLRGLSATNMYTMTEFGTQTVEVSATSSGNVFHRNKTAPPPPPIPQPEKIGVTATVQCAFQIL